MLPVALSRLAHSQTDWVAADDSMGHHETRHPECAVVATRRFARGECRVAHEYRTSRIVREHLSGDLRVSGVARGREESFVQTLAPNPHRMGDRYVGPGNESIQRHAHE